ncbi:MAG: hypothetical protein H0T15_02180 [Thermoleophilaceae bacterium]|nr:hypothetical protein [Thermoleophilaceae bacterium]
MGDPDFLSGSSGTVTSPKASLRDLAMDASLLARGIPLRLARAAREKPPRRRVLAVGVERTDVPNLMPAAREELARSRHGLTLRTIEAGAKGKWENVGELLAATPAAGHDWLVLVDDDVVLPRGFLDGFLFLAERFDLRIAQPAHRRRSHGAWEVTRREWGSVVRETRFVEQGPLAAFHSSTFETLLPFPPLRMGWGLDLHWSAIAAERKWRIGVVDALPVKHGLREVAGGYGTDAAVEEAREFLADRPYVRAEQAAKTLAAHRRW